MNDILLIMRYLKTTIIVLSVIFSATEVKSQSTVAIGIKIGNKAPEIVENSSNGRLVKLSSLSGKIVLIDFWASWCKPCRNENPFVVKAYGKYKDSRFKGGKGFTVFSVSLDRDLNAWKKAIQVDHLTWENHVCVPNGTAEYVQTYAIRTIPTNFLIDGNGVILATNLRGAAIEQKLASLKK